MFEFKGNKSFFTLVVISGLLLAIGVFGIDSQQSHSPSEIVFSESIKENVVIENDLEVGGTLSLTGNVVLQGASEGIVSTLSDGSLTSVQIPNRGQSFGSDMITNEMALLGLWNAHENNCNSNEGFIPLFTGSSRGFCIEKNERSARQWISARRDCLSNGKRLPEAGEWLVACTFASDLGITQMTGNNHEWSSNFPRYLPYYSSGSTIQYGYYVPLLGNEGCNFASWGWLAHKTNGGSAGSHAYRCVH